MLAKCNIDCCTSVDFLRRRKRACPRAIVRCKSVLHINFHPQQVPAIGFSEWSVHKWPPSLGTLYSRTCLTPAK